MLLAMPFRTGTVSYARFRVVGGPTAGANGNILLLPLPGGFRFSWTGMKVTKFDGSQHHLVGIRPTVPVERTLKAVRDGRDEYIEKALELIRGQAVGRKRSRPGE